uniref:Uncharacterized protein n=1 Tax=Avena sativa TaxID=4498 RepID=A0ACD5TYA8_AVESA
MHRLNSATTPMYSRILLRRSSTTTSTSPPSRLWDPDAALAAATERVRAGTLSPEDAHHLFDELLQQDAPAQAPALDSFFAALARAPDPSARKDGRALAVALFNRACREEAGRRVAPLTARAYGILMDCCCRLGRPDLGLAFFGRLLKTGLRTNDMEAYTLIKCLCGEKRTDEAVEVLLHRMPELGCAPDVLSYSLVLKILCDDSKSQRALDLLQMMAKQGGRCSPNVVAYSTVIHGFCKEGKVSEACDLFSEMKQQGVEPDVVTYTPVIGALCKARAMDKAELLLRQMIDDGFRPNNMTYSYLVHGYSSLGLWEVVVQLFREMTSEGDIPNIVPRTTSFIISLCKHGRSKEAAEIALAMIKSGTKVSPSTYGVMLAGLCRDNCTDEAIVLFQKLGAMSVKFNITTFNTMINVMYRARRREEAKDLFAAISANGLVPDASTYEIMITNLLKEGSMEEADQMFSSMERSGCTPSSRLINDIIRMLLEKGEILKAGKYLAKVDGKSISLESSTSSLMMSLFSRDGKFREQIKSLPARYRFYGVTTVE